MVDIILMIMRKVRKDVPAHVVADFLEEYVSLCADAAKASDHYKKTTTTITPVVSEDLGLKDFLAGLRKEAEAKEKKASEALIAFLVKYADPEE